MRTLTQEGNKLVFEYNGERMVIEPWGDNSLRVRAICMGEEIDTNFALLPVDESNAEILFDGDNASITNGKIKAVVEGGGFAPRGRITFYNQKGEVLLEEIESGGALNYFARKMQSNLGGDYALTATFKSNENEKLFGMGQYQQDILDLKFCCFELAHRNSQASIPFVLSSLGYGFLWHNPAIGTVNFGKNITSWFAESTKQLDYWITAGDTPAEIEEAYASVTGYVPMMPEYGLGFWQCKLRYWNQEQLLEVAREYKRRNIPIDVIVCDFFHWPKMGDFRFEDEFFPNPQLMVDELKQMGIELMVSVWPQIDLTSENYEEMKQKNLLVHTERGVDVQMLFAGQSVFYDTTNPKARKYVWDKCKKNYYDYGIKIFWLDEAEPEYNVCHFDNYRYHMGTSVQVGNIYPQVYAKGFYEGMSNEGQENIVNLVRCAWAGSQRYGALVWSGDIHSDFETLRRQVCAGLNMGIAGIPWWTTDIGGFGGGDQESEDFRELLVRWFQYGTFCPVMRLHGARDHGEQPQRMDGTYTLFSGGDNEVWSYGEKVYDILVKYIKIRENMRDYTRELMEEAHKKGTPVIRTMFYEFPEDEICWTLKEQYMYGSDILVAPILYKGAIKREVYLPKGVTWVDMNTNQEFEGGQRITVDAPIDIIPVFKKKKA